MIAVDADAIEKRLCEGFVALRSSIVAVNENVDLAMPQYCRIPPRCRTA